MGPIALAQAVDGDAASGEDVGEADHLQEVARSSRAISRWSKAVQVAVAVRGQGAGQIAARRDRNKSWR